MKKVIIFACVATTLVVLFLCTGTECQNKSSLSDNKKETRVALDSLDVKDMPVLKFAKTKYNFGTVRPKGEPISIVFDFQNTGGVPLLIHKVDVSCGCMTVEFPKEPTIPRQKGSITVKIDSKNRVGAFNKTLFVKSNATEDVILLRIVGQIK